MLLNKNVMKSRIVLLLLFNAFLLKSNSQVFLINLTDSSFTYNEKILKANDKICYVFNYLSKNNTKSGNFSLKPLILFKVFDYKAIKLDTTKPTKAILVSDYLNSTVLPKLSLDMQLRAKSFEVSNSDPNFHVIDSLIVFDGKSYRLLEGGVVVLEFFNVCAYTQIEPVQTNQSALNIKANPIKVYEWVNDNEPIPNIEALIDGKMFLLKKEKNDYTFFRHPFDCSDCPLTFYNEYVYRKGFGIIAFKSKYLFKQTAEFVIEKIGESREYYYFR